MTASRFIALAAALGAAACGDSVSVSNATPEGSVGGLVVDAATMQPIAGATVRLIAGGRTFDAVETGGDGSFAFTDVPAGSVIVQIDTPAGYWGATVRGALTGSAGEFPIGNEVLTLGPIGLVPAATTFTVRVLSESGAPVANYNLGLETSLEWVDFSSGAPNAIGRRGFAATTNADGYATFATALPDYWRLGTSVPDAVVVLLPPWDADMDGAFEFAGNVRVFNMRTLGDPTPDVVLDPNYEAAIYVVASTIPQLEGGGAGLPGVIGTSDPIWIKFNLPIEEASLDVNVVTETGSPVMATTNVTDDLLKITFPALTAGAEYNLHVHVVTKVGDRFLQGDFAAPFFTRNPAATITATPSKDPSTGAVRITFSEPIGTGNPGLNYLAGGDCVLFFNADLGGAPLPIGDYPGELGNPNCEAGRAFYAVEPDPAGPVGLSGYSSVWEFYPPAPGGNPIPPATPIHIFFSRVSNPAYVIERPDGRPVHDFTGGMSIFMP